MASQVIPTIRAFVMEDGTVVVVLVEQRTTIRDKIVTHLYLDVSQYNGLEREEFVRTDRAQDGMAAWTLVEDDLTERVAMEIGCETGTARWILRAVKSCIARLQRAPGITPFVEFNQANFCRICKGKPPNNFCGSCGGSGLQQLAEVAS